MDRLTVLMIANIPRNIENIKGGVEAATVNLIIGFKNEPVNLHIVSIRSDIEKSEEIRLHEGCIIHYRPFTLKKSAFAEYFWFGWLKIRRLIKKLHPDLIHNQDTGPVMLMLRGMDKRKVIITQHGIYSEELKYEISVLRRLKFRIKMIYDKLLLPRYCRYISISDYNRRILVSYHTKNPEFYTEIIYNPVNSEFFFNTSPHGAFTKIIYVGVVNKRKGVHILLEALIKLRERGIIYSLDIAGGTKEPKYMEMIEDMIKENNLGSQVTLHGWVNQAKVKQLLEECAIFLLPSSQECLPISIAEAMAAERVVVATRTGGIPEMITDKESGFLFDINDSGQLSEILSYLYKNHGEIMRVSANAKSKALEMFRPETVALQTLNFYRTILSKVHSA